MLVGRQYERAIPRPGAVADNVNAAAVLRPAGFEIVMLIVATLFATLGYVNGGDLVSLTNYLVPALLVTGLSWGCYAIAARDIAAIWAPLFWNRVVLIAYFGVGSVVPFFVNFETLSYIQSFYLFFPEDVGKYNLVNCVFMVCYQLVSLIILAVLSGRQRSGRTVLIFEPSSLDLKVIALGLLVVGLAFYYGFILPVTLGLADTNVPLLIAELSNGYLVGLFLLTFWSLRHQSRFIILVFAVLFVQFTLGVIGLNKSEALYPAIMVAVGFIFDRPTFRRMAGGFVIILGLYLTIASIVGTARDIAFSNVYDTQSVAVATRLEALQTAWELGEDATIANPIQAGWTRLSYVNAATFAIGAYDQGAPGSTLDNALIVFIPRVLYPDKPSITAGAIAFNVAANGSDTSQSTPGIPAEGYWNAGWFGVVMFAISVSIVSTLWSIYTLATLHSGAWHLFFIVLLGMRAGARLDGLFVPDVVGPVGFAIVGHFALQLLNRLIARGTARPHLATG